ncbi:MAG: superoxide dismutase family protein [Parachlamydiaceae bacterium]
MKIRIAVLILSTMAASCFAAVESPPALAEKAVAVLHATEGNKVSGTVTFTTVPGGTRIVADVYHLNPGKHGFHVHEHGDCSAHDGSTAGGHFNPTGKNHGGPDSEDRHVGDMGNLFADFQGYAHYDRVDDLLQLTGSDTIIGRSIVIHANEDDFTTQPTGNSGARIACGVINSVEEKKLQ